MDILAARVVGEGTQPAVVAEGHKIAQQIGTTTAVRYILIDTAGGTSSCRADSASSSC